METECDFAMLHCTLSEVPEDLPWETLISKAGDYFIQFPPSELAAEAERIFQKGVRARESCITAKLSRGGRGAVGGQGRGAGQLMTRNKDGAWIPLDQPKKVAARIVMWTLYASVRASAFDRRLMAYDFSARYLSAVYRACAHAHSYAHSLHLFER